MTILEAANELEAEAADRSEELKDLTIAKKIIKQNTGDTADQSYPFFNQTLQAAAATATLKFGL